MKIDREEVMRIAQEEYINHIFLPPTAVKGSDDIQPAKRTVFTGEIPNAFMASSDDVGTIQKGDVLSGGLTEYRTNPLNKVYFMKNDLFDNTLSPQTKRLFLFNLSKLAQNVRQHETNINTIREGSLKPFSLSEYMSECGLKDRKEAIKNIKNSIKELLNTRVSFDVDIYVEENNKRKKRNVAMNTDILTLAIDTTDRTNKKLTPSEYIDHCIEKGLVYMSFDLDLASVLVNFPLLALPAQLFKVDIHRNGHALDLGYYLLNLARMSRNKVSILNMLKACPDLPLEQLLKRKDIESISKQGTTKDTIRLYKHILEPIKKTLESLKKDNILKSYKLVDNKGKAIKFEDLTKETLEANFIIFELADGTEESTDEPKQPRYKTKTS
jgi:hypothetical protein